ncbi:MAG TPA: response regulator [Bryobacteraceae bacterium]|nr:response regulator [Bryobacteraceae bacterium]
MPRILVVEDNEWSRDILARRLARRGYQVVLAADGKRGILLAQSQSPDLILMDMSLPEMDGWEATRRLKSDPATRAIPIVALTAHAMASDRKKAMDAGCDDYHTKPVDFERLMRAVKSLLAARNASAPAANIVATSLDRAPAALLGDPPC